MTEVIKVEDCGENIGDYDVQIYNAILIPKNATNGDMMKALYPNASFVEVDYAPIIRMFAGDFCVEFRKSWLNARYKGVQS